MVKTLKINALKHRTIQ